MAGTTSVTPFRGYTGADGEFYLPISTDEFTLHQTPNILLLFQHDVDTSYLDKDVGKLQTKTQVRHIQSSLVKEKKNNRKTRKTHQTQELPNYEETWGLCPGAHQGRTPNHFQKQKRSLASNFDETMGNRVLT